MNATGNSFVPVAQALRIALDHQRAGRLAQAEGIYRQVLAVEPNNANALHLLGLVAHQHGQYAAAVDLIGRAIRIRDSVPDYHTNLGEALRAQGMVDQALEAQQCAARLAPNVAEIQVNLGNAYQDGRRLAEAITHYQKALRLDPGSQAATANLAICLERLNRVDEAGATATRGLTRWPLNPELNVVAAKVARRQGRLQDGIALLGRLLNTNLPPPTRARGLYELGGLLDRTEAFDQAFEAFAEANLIARGIAQSQGIENALSHREIAETLAVLNRQFVASWPQAPREYPRPAPTFVVGFPRSGTTLLEVILKSHSRVHTLDELPIVESLKKLVMERTGSYPEGIARLQATDLRDLRAAYFKAADPLSSIGADRLLVDKLPLNIAYLPLINRVFPDAKIIFAARHPADSVLSCFMQGFSPNSAMANFFTIEDTADFYNRVMGLWRQAVDTLPMSCHMVKYENVVGRFDDEIGGTLRFLGLAWEDAVRDYTKTARQGGGISTPSYHQVSESLYQRANGRWQHYRRHMEPILGILEPWVRYLGYAG